MFQCVCCPPFLSVPVGLLVRRHLNDQHARLSVLEAIFVVGRLWRALGVQHEDLGHKDTVASAVFFFPLASRNKNGSTLLLICHKEITTRFCSVYQPLAVTLLQSSHQRCKFNQRKGFLSFREPNTRMAEVYLKVHDCVLRTNNVSQVQFIIFSGFFKAEKKVNVLRYQTKTWSRPAGP